MPKLTDREKQWRKFKREAEKQWRRELCMSMANEAVEANKVEMGIKHEHLSPSFVKLVKLFSK